MEGVKFYSPGDLATGYLLKQAEEIIVGYELNSLKDINIVLELFNCTLYLDNKVYFKNWTEEYIEHLNEKCKGIKKDISCYFTNISEANIENYVKDIRFNFAEDFLTLFCKYKLYNRIGEGVFTRILERDYFSIQQICHYQKLVDNYETVVKNVLLKNPLNAELLFDQFVIDHSDALSKKLYFPKSLTKSEMSILIDSYIDTEKANLNYLRLIVNNHNTREFFVSDELKWKAKKHIHKQEEMHFRDNSGLEFGYEIIFQEDLPEPVIAKSNGREASITFNKTWLEAHLDFATILQNFIWFFNFIDSNGRITFVSHTSEISALENVLGLKSNRDYPRGIMFRSKEILSNLMTSAYYMFLKSQSITFEKVIEWFFTDYLYKEFKVTDYYAVLPTEGATYKEKCRDILPEMEFILSQFKSYVEYGYINHDLLGISSSGFLYEQIPSLIGKKYVYPNEILNVPFFYMFSDQSGLGYINNEINSDTFYELIVKNDINYSEFNNHQQLEIDVLCKLGYLNVDEKGLINWTNERRIKVLYELYHNEVISYYRMQPQIREEIDLMVQENLIMFKSSLFSKPEQDYFNYYLNNAKFQNGPQLRNKYAHGTLGSRPNIDEDIHKQNYLVIIKLFILIILKINEDLCLYDMVNETEQSK
ncbi:Putative orphan protein [Bacillus velezensis UCMB5036]|uniref:hypothetical protein n=2 Tax=Bacillus amyloliquefaciens group TaxID=1938374 RepID=UPI0002B6B795|nr:hypothetical protein [Bacillus velezensis]MCY7684277.1 hypothetical protein [Bacillus velezensis]NCT28887.1 hypothetical protein [Bacillus velezensis]PAC78029.1 hypothetical protein CHI11_09540 [Bacillus velezensis]QJC94455.1 hypothetical protein HC661_36670 [Bacillus velezensis]CCP23633.1 Putative orphan protein [Bacillus velezensis UCMB5036]